MVKVTHHITAEELARLRKLSQKTGLSVAELVRRAIDQYTQEANQ